MVNPNPNPNPNHGSISFSQAGELWRNPYSLGARANFEQVFGLSRRSFSWLLPSFKAPPGDGMEFPTTPGGALHEV